MMKMSNSALVNYTKISPNRTSPRKNKIDTITIHCVVGQCSVETLGAIFAPSSRQASSNYGVGYDGRFGMYCEEKDRSWCSSSAANDNRAITIEVASDTTEPYAVNDKAYILRDQPREPTGERKTETEIRKGGAQESRAHIGGRKHRKTRSGDCGTKNLRALGRRLRMRKEKDEGSLVCAFGTADAAGNHYKDTGSDFRKRCRGAK